MHPEPGPVVLDLEEQEAPLRHQAVAIPDQVMPGIGQHQQEGEQGHYAEEPGPSRLKPGFLSALVKGEEEPQHRQGAQKDILKLRRQQGDLGRCQRQ